MCIKVFVFQLKLVKGIMIKSEEEKMLLHYTLAAIEKLNRSSVENVLYKSAVVSKKRFWVLHYYFHKRRNNIFQFWKLISVVYLFHKYRIWNLETLREIHENTEFSGKELILLGQVDTVLRKVS